MFRAIGPLMPIHVAGRDIVGQIDTGAFTTAIDVDILHELGFRPIHTESIRGPFGENRDLPVFEIDVTIRATMGELVFHLPVVGSQCRLQSHGQYEALIGRNLLEHTELLIDFTSDEMTVRFKKP